ncbi:MAG: hypothetical protein AB2693_23530 [Candidatus Thiodiazotropha sp.]
MDVGDIKAVPLLAEEMRASILALRVFIKILIEMNENIRNKLNLSGVYRSINYTGLLAKFK